MFTTPSVQQAAPICKTVMTWHEVRKPARSLNCLGADSIMGIVCPIASARLRARLCCWQARCTELLLAVTAPRVLMMTFACYMSANSELAIAFAGVVDVSVLCFVAMLTGGCAASSLTAQAFFDNAAVPLHVACDCLLAMHIRSSRCEFRDCIELIGCLQVHGWY
jgi:hypothetical protein